MVRKRKYDISPELAAAIRAGQANKQRVERTCEACGTPFVGLATRRFCSGRCRARQWYRRQRARTSENGD